MTIGNKLLELRKKACLSQEEAAEKLGVTRQTISKWETDQSTPDFDKLDSICKLYNVTANELINGIKEDKEEEIPKNNLENKRKRALGIGISVCLYFLAVVQLMVTVPLNILDPILASGLFLLICGIATGIIVYVSIFYKNITEEDRRKKEENKIVKQINEVIAIIVLVIYLLISFITNAWHITWIIWIIYALIEEIVKLIFMLRGAKNEE